jgi:S1-C subfamily serine protease
VKKFRLPIIAVVFIVFMVALVNPSSATQSSAPTPPTATAEERAAAQTRPAVVYIETYWRGWVRDQRDGQLWLSEAIEFSTSCTGFIVSPDGYIVTAGHCMDAGLEGVAPYFFDEVIAQYAAEGYEVTYEELVAHSIVEGTSAGSMPDLEIYVQQGVAASGLKGGEAYSARVVDLQPASRGDVTLLKIDAENLPTVSMAPEDNIEIGTPLLAIGYPGSTDAVTDLTLEPTNKGGTVSAKKTAGGVPFYEISAAVSQGMSGGPVVDTSTFEVIGLISFGPSGETQAFNYISASSTIQEILTRNGVEPETSRVDTIYTQGLEAYWAGNYTEAIKQFDTLLELVPSHQQAQEFKTQAAERRAEFGDRVSSNSASSNSASSSTASSNPSGASKSEDSNAGLIIAGGCGALFLGGATAVVVVIRRRRRRQSGTPTNE